MIITYKKQETTMRKIILITLLIFNVNHAIAFPAQQEVNEENMVAFEHWDVIQAIPETSANDNGMF